MPEHRHSGSRLHGLQLWVALPVAHEEAEPSFHHHPGTTLPERDHRGVKLRVLAGAAYNMTSPVEILSPLFYVDAVMSAGTELALPAEHESVAVSTHQPAGHHHCEPAEHLESAEAYAHPPKRTQEASRP